MCPRPRWLECSVAMPESVEKNALSGQKWTDLWRAHELARTEQYGLDTGYPALNAVLPGGGWPQGLIELLQSRPGCGEWGLLAPALARVCGAGGPGRVGHALAAVLVGAPHAPMGGALAARGLEPSHVLHVAAMAPVERLWAAEQALRCAGVGCVMLWLDTVQAAHLRRLHMAAQEHAKLLFVFRPQSAQHESSPAPLRLLMQWGDAVATNQPTPVLLVRVLKRRGPPLDLSLSLLTATPGLQALLAASRAQARGRRGSGSALNREPVHALGRVASLA